MAGIARHVSDMLAVGGAHIRGVLNSSAVFKSVIARPDPESLNLPESSTQSTRLELPLFIAD